MTGRRWVLGAAVVAVVGIGIATWSVVGTRAETGDDEVEVCETTEYEGCPQRWEYLWADDE